MSETAQASTSDPTSGGAGPSRRTLLKAAVGGAGALWVAPTIDSLRTPAAAASGSQTTNLQKDNNGTLAGRCVPACDTGLCSPAGRGTVTFTRTESPTPTITVSISLASGPDVTGRSIYVMQTDGTNCLAQSLTGSWAATPANGPQTFSASIVTGATYFAVHIPASGGGGTDIYTSYRANLP